MLQIQYNLHYENKWNGDDEMSKIELAIIDRDVSYLKAFVDFLSTDYNYKFNISHFTELDYLIKYLSSDNCSIDILLIDDASFNDELLKYDIGEIVLMTEGSYHVADKNLKSVNKYQAGDNLISDVLNCCSDSQNIVSCASHGIRRSKVIAVYSPIGGVGKTSIAMGTAMRCVDKDFKVFYLNLESASSTDVFFNCSKIHSFSEILYFLKEKDKNIISKIDALKSVDIVTGIHFFGSPNRISDYEEIESEDYIKLIKTIIEIGIYDFIFIDFSSEINKRNISILDICDKVMLLTLDDMFSRIKLKKLYDEMKAIDSEIYERVNNKTINIINKSNQHSSAQDDENCIRIPEINGLINYRQEKVFFNLNSEIVTSLDKVISLLTNDIK
jgi:cellulose biosynthesis protein BcsQ